MNLHQYRTQVRQLLRDDSYPEYDLDSAINRVVADINVMGRFRFHESSYTLNLTANNAAYAIPEYVLAEKIFLYAGANNSYTEIPRKREVWLDTPLISNNTGSVPVNWSRYANNWYIDPTPDSTMAANDITVLYEKDLSLMMSPADTCGLPNRHANVIIYGAAAQLRPGLIVAAPEGQVAVETMYARAVSDMKHQEMWNFASIPSMRPGPRFANMSSWGFSGRIR